VQNLEFELSYTIVEESVLKDTNSRRPSVTATVTHVGDVNGVGVGNFGPVVHVGTHSLN